MPDKIEAIRAEITELKEDIEWGFVTDPKKLLAAEASLREAERRLARAEYAATIPAGISLERLNSVEAEQRHIRGELGRIAVEIGSIRGTINSTGWSYHSYERYEPDGMTEEYIYVTLTQSARYEPNYQTISFPASYLDADWRTIENEKVAAEKAEAAEQKRVAAEAAMIAREERQRAEYARLKNLYGDA